MSPDVYLWGWLLGLLVIIASVGVVYWYAGRSE